MFADIFNLFFPKLCEACSKILTDHEALICTSCRHELPITNFHFTNSDTVKKILYGRVQLEYATALFYFSKKSNVQHLIHNLKYKGHESISEALGLWLGAELQSLSHYRSIDVVVPVPLHKKRLRKRGYNQVTKFGKAIATALNAEYVNNVLIKQKSTRTKVFKDRVKRWSTDNSVFAVTETQSLKDKHILIVDDVITTGATIEACAEELLKIDNIKLSLATMAIAE